ncbi:hypothetical protein [Streptomyces minutiscleroticus]|uniref:hypothetical protein n=1 Tax=Streptomyces minutiscleroticus TaxID=68238 RepID=UPI0033341976
MNGIALTLRALHHGEGRLARHFVTVAQRHRTEHEVHHVAGDLAAWSREHVRRLADTAAGRGLDLGGPSGTSDASDDGILATLRRKTAELTGHRPEPALLLLRDLRDLHLDATENSLHWEMLAQAAQASRDSALLGLASACHPQTLRQMRWTNTMIKTLSPQALTSP